MIIMTDIISHIDIGITQDMTGIIIITCLIEGIGNKFSNHFIQQINACSSSESLISSTSLKYILQNFSSSSA